MNYPRIRAASYAHLLRPLPVSPIRVSSTAQAAPSQPANRPAPAPQPAPRPTATGGKP